MWSCNAPFGLHQKLVESVKLHSSDIVLTFQENLEIQKELSYLPERNLWMDQCLIPLLYPVLPAAIEVYSILDTYTFIPELTVASNVF